jgi:hypothetical protein
MSSRKFKICLALFAIFLTEPTLAQVNLSATAGTPTGSYTTLGAAFSAINAGTHQGVITINVTASTTEGATPAALNASGSGSASYTSVTVRPTAVVTISGTPAANRGIIELNGADNITIDGDITGGPVNRDLTIINNSPSATNNTAVIRLVGSATVGNCSNNTIQNCIIVGNLDGSSYTTATYNAGIYAANGSATPTITNSNTNGLDYDNLTIQNNEIRKAYVGIAVRSSSTTTGVNDNLTITQNIIGSNTPSDYVVFRGIQMENVNGGNISQNEVFNIRLLATVGTSNAGIDLFGSGTANVNITRNKVWGVASPSTSGWGAYGINVTAGSNATIANNVIYDITTTHYLATSTTFNAFGIRLAGGTLHKVWYNSVHLYGDYSTAGTAGSASAAFCVTSTTVTADIRNNIFANKLTASGSTSTQKEHKAVWFPAAFNFTNVTINNNSYNIPAATAGTEHFVGKVGTTAGTGNSNNLTAWQTATSQDGLSVPTTNTNAPFTANNDLTIPANTNTPIESGAATITITVDHDNFTRPKAGLNPNLAPDIGAYEFDGINGLPNDVGIFALTAPPAIGCYGATETVTVTIRNHGVATLPAGTNIPVTVNVTGATTATLNGTYTVGAGGFPALTNVSFTLPGTLNMTTAGTYTFNASTAMTSPMDMNSSNDAMSPVNRTVVAPLSLPYTENFNSYPDASVPTNWTVDMGSTLDFRARSNHGATADMGLAGNVYSANATSFAIMPKLGPFGSSGTLTFDYRIVDYTGYANPGGTATAITTTDSVYIEYSLDCGVSFTKLPGSIITSTTHTTSNLFVNKSITLPGSFSGQNVIFRWIAKWGAGDYWVDIDNINIITCPTMTAPNNTTPPANLTICSGNSTTLTATAVGTGTLTWYDVMTGGTSLGTGGTFTTPVLTAKDTFYVAEEMGACVSSRTMIIVNVVPLPAAPTIVSIMPNDTVCAGTNITVTMSGTGTIKWYDTPTGGTPFFTGSVISGTAMTTDSAYVTADNGTCESSPRVKVKIVVNPLPTVNYNVPSSQDTVCTTDAPFTLMGGTPSGGTYSGGSYITGGNTFNPATAGTGSKMVIYTYTNTNGCSNADTSYIEVKVCTEVKNAMANNSYYLGQSYPNPTENTANVDIYVPKTERVLITLMNLEGKVIKTLLDENISGNKTLQVDTSNLPAGMYMYRMQAGSYTDLKRMSVIK